MASRIFCWTDEFCGSRRRIRVLKRFQLESAGSDHKRVNRHLSLFPVRRELESLGQETLHHLARLICRCIWRHRSLKVVRVFRAAVRARLSRPIWQAFRVNPSNVIGIPDKIVQRSTKLEETARKSLHADNPYRFVVIAWSKRSSIKAQLGELGGFPRYMGSRRGHGARATGGSLPRVTECTGCKAGAERGAQRGEARKASTRDVRTRDRADYLADAVGEAWAGHGCADCVKARAGVHYGSGHVHEGFGVGGGVVTLCQNCGVAALFGERGEFAFEPPGCGMEPEDCAIEQREPLH